MIAEKEECVVFKNLQSNWTEKCSKQIIASEEMNAMANESMSKKNFAHVLVQEDKEAFEEVTVRFRCKEDLEAFAKLVDQLNIVPPKKRKKSIKND